LAGAAAELLKKADPDVSYLDAAGYHANAQMDQNDRILGNFIELYKNAAI
jgi:hypothetical protein